MFMIMFCVQYRYSDIGYERTEPLMAGMQKKFSDLTSAIAAIGCRWAEEMEASGTKAQS